MGIRSRPHADRTRSWLLLAALLAAGPLQAAPAREVTLLATTDFHGALIGGGRDRRTDRPWGGAVALVARVRQERALRADRTFLLDGGDEMQGSPESNFVFGRSAVAVLRALGTDAAALGNHEFDWGIDTLCARQREMGYPMLAGNVFEKATGRRPAWLRPWALVRRDGVVLGVVGLATPETPRTTLPPNVASLRFEPPERALPALVREVRRAGADIVVVLGHMGGEQDATGEIRGPVSEVARVARAVGADAVIGGHTHTFVAGSVDGLPVLVAGSNGRVLGRVVLEWDGRRTRPLDVRLLPAYSDSLAVPPWDPIAAHVDSVERAVRPFRQRVLGRAARPLRRTDLANLVTDALRSATGSDVAIMNPGGLRRDLDTGPITAGDLFELLPFENAVVTVHLRGEELRAVIASRPEKTLLAGLHGRWDPGAPAGERLLLLHADGSPLGADSTYLVATNSFVALGGDDFVGFEGGRGFTVHPTLVRDAVGQWIESETRAGRAVDPDSRARFEVPEPAPR